MPTRRQMITFRAGRCSVPVCRGVICRSSLALAVNQAQRMLEVAEFMSRAGEAMRNGPPRPGRSGAKLSESS